MAQAEEKKEEAVELLWEDYDELDFVGDMPNLTAPSYVVVNTIYALLLATLAYLVLHISASEQQVDDTGVDDMERLQNCLMVVVGTVVFCTGTHVVSRFVWRAVLPDYYSIPFADRVSLSEKVLSSIHGFVVGTAAINHVFVENLWATNLIRVYPLSLDWIYSFSAGYEIYDLATMAMQRDSSIAMWVHHTLILIGYSLVMSYRRMAFVSTIMLITELTVLPSNLHWYLKTLGQKDTRAFHFNQGLRLWSFIVLRLFTAPYVLYELLKQGSEVLVNEDAVTVAAAFLIPALLGMMNIYWTKTMYTLYSRRTRLRDKIAKKRSAKAQKAKAS
mmetsp:Transcript_15454/g.60417  ORF Transcript_15454/g.60417 Transcript_15454/m.60417 type:complete len:331 (-) Transcript_15454:65-1057(-)